MENFKLNETPVRTANNFGINNIEVMLDIPQYKQYDNFNLYAEDIEKIKVEISNKPSTNTNKIGLERKTNYIVKIVIPENTKIEEPIKLEFDFDDENEFLVENIDILLENNSSADFEIIYNSSENKCFHNGQINTKLQENAKSKISLINMINNVSDSIYAIENKLDTNSILEYVIVEFGGNKKISNYYSKLQGEKSKNYLNMIYLGKEKELIDINYNMETYAPKTESYINVQGALKDYAKKNFKGTIDFKKGAVKAIGKENENCIILSPNCKSKSLPMLLCHEEDVEGEHGVSSGKIDENKLFYIMTKGISYSDAKKIIIKANFSNILSKIDDDNIKEIISNEIEKL